MRRNSILCIILVLAAVFFIVGCGSGNGSSIWTRGTSGELEAEGAESNGAEEDIYAAVSGTYANPSDPGDLMALYKDGTCIFAYKLPYESTTYTADEKSMTITLDIGRLYYIENGFSGLTDEYGKTWRNMSSEELTQEYEEMLKDYWELKALVKETPAGSEKDQLQKQLRELETSMKSKWRQLMKRIEEEAAPKKSEESGTDEGDKSNEDANTLQDRIAGDWVYNPDSPTERFGFTFYEDGSYETGYGVANTQGSYYIDAGSMTIELDTGEVYTIGGGYDTLTSPSGKVLRRGDWRDPNRAL
jgi:hypothetical protein